MKHLKTLLIANRGEIATRILKTAKYSADSFRTYRPRMAHISGVGSSVYAPLQYTRSLTQLLRMYRRQMWPSCFVEVRKPIWMGRFLVKESPIHAILQLDFMLLRISNPIYFLEFLTCHSLLKLDVPSYLFNVASDILTIIFD